MFDTHVLKKDFPLFQQAEYSQLAYLDNAATTQKPQVVLDAITNFYKTSNANVHRGIHKLSDRSTEAWLMARETVAQFLGASTTELIITRNATEAINGVALGWVRHQLKPGDIIISSVIEHHANLVPWQEVARLTGAQLKLIPVLSNGTLDQDWYQNILTEKVKLVAIQHVSNVLGTLHPVEKMIEQAHRAKALFLLDAAQSLGRLPVNFHKIKADFLAFSGHKMYGPMGVGGLLVKKELLSDNIFKPWLFGGGMISRVSELTAEYQSSTEDRFTAGTPDVASLVGLAASCNYLLKLGLSNIIEHDKLLVQTALNRLIDNDNIQVIGPTMSNRVGSIAFTFRNVHPHDVAQVLDANGVAVRSGHHCCMPLHKFLGINGSVRASFGIYNSLSDIDQLISALSEVYRIFNSHS